ncbi:MAG: tyrosine-type recombinase/integrase [Lachnospiraceae bacterium]|nr:tyrosine-type recombinase/integrase [Lachnospiraceae bacterium]
MYFYGFQPHGLNFFGNTYKGGNGYIFTKEDGSCYDPDLLSKQFSRATKKYGRPEISLHNLRHSCASMAINRGWDVKQLQYWLGHSDIQTTLNIYAHYDRQRLKHGGDDMNEMSFEAAQLFKTGIL